MTWKPPVYYPVGTVAKLLSINARTVSDMFDSGILTGYRLPFGRKERRVSKDSVLKFASTNPGLSWVEDSLDDLDNQFSGRAEGDVHHEPV